MTDYLPAETADDDASSASSTSSNNDKKKKKKKKKKSRKMKLTPVIWCILVTETGERFAYYGFRAVLTLYFTTELNYTENAAIAMFAYTTALAYLSPILGALLADGHWGRYRTIVVFGAIYVVGMVILTVAAMADELDDRLELKNSLTIAGLLLICLGTGGIKPCVSAFGADQVKTIDTPPPVPPAIAADDANGGFCYSCQGCGPSLPEHFELDDFINECPPDARETTGEILLMDNDREEQVRVFFACFYFCINVGAVTSIAIIPTVRGVFGFGAAFLVPTIFMVVAMGLFLSMSHKYVHNDPGGEESGLSTTFSLCWYLLKKNTWPFVPSFLAPCLSCLRPEPTEYMKRKQQAKAIPLDSLGGDNNKDAEDFVTDYSAHYDSDAHTDEALEQHLSDAKQALRVLPIMALTPLFWMLYDQQSSVWVLQAARMELMGLEPEQMNAVNPVQIMIFIPLFDRIIYPWMDRHAFNIRQLRRMEYGMLCCALAFFLSGILETMIEEGEALTQQDGLPHKINVFWQVPQITLLSIAEIFVSVTGMEFVYAASPQRLKASLTALFLLTTAVGDFLSGVLYSTVFRELNRAVVMHICGFSMMLNLLVFCFVAWWWEMREAARKIQSNAASSEASQGLISKQGEIA